jgi:hypothetical protein
MIATLALGLRGPFNEGDKEVAMFADRFRKLLETADRSALEDLYAADALLDVNVPTWRFQRKGTEDIAAQYAEWTAEGAFHVGEIRELEGPWGSVIENDQREPDGTYSRQIHLLFADGDKVARHVMYCTGQWDAETQARQKAEAPMVEP